LPLYDAVVGKARFAIDLALERLNFARQRSFPGDMALDGAIALEALLGDTSGEEVTYRLRIRAALFLGASHDERERISRTVRDFYGIRSKVAHGRVSARDAGGPKGPEVIDEALELCAQAIRAVCRLGQIPHWADLELGRPIQRDGAKE
jgi:hypothetical protein